MTDESMPENFYSSMKDNDEIDLGKIFRLLLMQSKLIILIVFAVFVISYVNYSLATKKYLIQSLLQYESFNQNIFNPSKNFQLTSPASATSISNLINLYESRTNLIKVIKDLNLNINIKDLDDNESIDIKILSDISLYNKAHLLKFSFSESGYTLLDDDLNDIQTSEYGEEILFKDLRISIESSNLEKYRPIEVQFRYPENMYNFLRSKLNVNTNISRNSFFSNNEGLITVSYETDDIDLGKQIINYANNIFLNQRMFLETEKSRKAISFIDKNIDSISLDVEENKRKLKEFLEKNKSIDVNLEIEAIVKKIQSLDQSLSTIDIEIAKAEETYTQTNPIYLNLLRKKTFIERQTDEVLSEIKMMPKEQQEYIDLYNELEISRTIYEELESRRLGFSILEASTIGDIRIVDNAYVVSLQSPNLIYVLVMTFIALIVACFIAIIRGLNFLPLSNPAEIFDNNISVPIIGVIPEVKNIASEEGIALNSSIESLIVNIDSLINTQSDKKIITITSPTPFNGKSTIAMKLAEGYAKIGKKILLLDSDLKRGKIGTIYDVKSISEKTFFSIDELSIDKYTVNDNLYFIPRVQGLDNTFQFLYNPAYKEKINFFKDYFDLMIIDTGPILSLSDTSILVEQSDFNLLVARHGVSRINEVKQALDSFRQINANIDGLVYNAYSKPKSYYGYYGVYGNYSYQYYAEKYLDDTYDYEKKV
jgi:tyrosine-protein kinase Etk/Wzc